MRSHIAEGGDLSSLLEEVAEARRAAARPRPKPAPVQERAERPKQRGIAPWEERELQELEERIGALEE